MCGSMADIQSATAEIRQGKKKKKPQDENIVACPIGRPYTGMNNKPTNPYTTENDKH